MPFKQKGADKLDAKVELRLTKQEKAHIREDAKVAGLSMSELGRRRLFGRRIVARVDTTMINEALRLGGLLKHIHTESKGAYQEATEKAVIEIQHFIKSLSK